MEIRIIVLGDFGVGKTSLLRKLKTNVFDEHIPSSVGFDFFSIRSEKNGRDVIMQFWDTAGQQKFQTITQQYFHRANGIAIIASAQRSNKEKVQQFRKYLSQCKNHNPENPIILIITKMDLSKKYETDQKFDYKQQLKILANQYKCTPPIYLSAKTSEQIQIMSAFENHLVKKILLKTAPSMVTIGQASKIQLTLTVNKKDQSKQIKCCSE